MFQQLYELAKTTVFVMTVSADPTTETLTLNVIPKSKKGEEGNALATPLTLTATPREFDENFPQCLTGYTGKYRSLLEQAEATEAVLEAAKKAQIEKGSKAASGATQKAKPSAVKAAPPKPEPAVAGNATGGGEKGASVEDDQPSLFD